jgi:hypothetical protein
VPSLLFPVMPHPIAGPPDKPAILAKMSEMRAAGNVPLNIDEFVMVAPAAVVEDRKRLVPDRVTLLARMTMIRATDDAPIPSDVLVTRAVASLEAEIRGDAVTASTPIAAVTPLAILTPIATRTAIVSPIMRPGDSYASNSIAAGAQRRYERSWHKWQKFASERGWSSLPAKADHLEDFLSDLANRTGSVAAVDGTIAAVGFFTSL